MPDLNSQLSHEHCAPRFQSWLSDQPGTFFSPLFDSTADLMIQSHVRNGKELLRRSSEMERAIIDLIEAGLKRDDWCGLLYVMCWGTSEEVRPLYIGKANRRGRKANVSANIRDIRRNRHKFARWGDGLDYHIGDLSHTLFRFDAYREPTEKYSRWADMLFVHRCPPRLREKTSLLLIPWFESSQGIGGGYVDLETAEDQLIEVALAEYEDIVLNVRGEVWWDQRASGTATPPSRHTNRKCTLIADSRALTNAIERLAASSRVGLDVETSMYTQELCLIQIADEKETFLIDALSVADLEPLRPILESTSITKIIHNAPFESRILGNLGFDIRAVCDTLKISRSIRGMSIRGGHGLAAVCQRELDELIDKGEQTSNWKRRPLTDSQIDYAATDAEVLLRLHDVMTDRRSGTLL